MAGCAAIRSGPVVQPDPSIPPNVYLKGVPFYPQKRYQCGPAALAMALGWSGVNARPEQLVPIVYTPGRRGSLQPGMMTGARRHGRLAYPLKGMDCLIRELISGRPVVVLQNLGLKWFPRWHYAVVVGYDMNERVIILHTGTKANRRVGFKTFEHTWKRAGQWGLMVLPAGKMPECVDETLFLKAALGLQLADQYNAALDAFKNAFRRWPESSDAAIALGNAHYQQGDLHEAIRVFYHAIRIEPGNGDSMNNLAHLLAEAGEIDEAWAMAERAVDAGGPHKEVYLKTLNEIRRKRR